MNQFAHLDATLSALPMQPGVYKMLDAGGSVLYVGKAKQLKKRVSSYFSLSRQASKTLRLLQSVDKIEVVVTATEDQALLLENQLIKRLQPRYNILLRDDKSYPYLYLSSQHAFPRLQLYRGQKGQVGEYYGPYTRGGALRGVIELVQKIFRIRSCSDRFFASRSRPCLQYQIKRCSAPCVGHISPAAYQKDIKMVQLLLKGQCEHVTQAMSAKMSQASQDKHYELAATYRDQIASLNQLHMPQAVAKKPSSLDVVVVVVERGVAVVQVLKVADEQVVDTQSFVFDDILSLSLEKVLRDFLIQYMQGEKMALTVMSNVVLSDALATEISGITGKSITFVRRVSAKRKSLLYMATQNAEHVIKRQQLMADKQSLRYSALGQFLGLGEHLSSIECFDISHISGNYCVASCVVFNAQGPDKANYRTYNVKPDQPGDDYAALYEAVSRRYQRMKTQGKRLPDVLIIDGGKGQLNAVNAALESIQVSDMCVIGVAKGPLRKSGLESIYLSGHGQPKYLPAHSPELLLILHCRDEAHRVALTAHRRRRTKASVKSILEGIPGIGAAKRRRILEHFGGLAAVKEASMTHLCQVPGLSRVLAQRVYDHFHDQDIVS